MRRIILGWGVLLVSCIGVMLDAPPIAHAQDPASSSYQVLAPAITSGGGYASSDSYSLVSVISEFSHTLSSASSFSLTPGFAAYPFVSTPVVSATPGDASASLSWTAAVGSLGYTVSSYSIGYSSVSGGSYSFASVGNVLSGSVSSLTNSAPYYFVVRAHDFYSTAVATSSEVSATPTAASSGSNNSGGGGVRRVVLNTGVNFSGRAYPRSVVTLLQDARVIASTVADANALFRISLTNVTAGDYVYSVYSEDSAGNRSSPLSFPTSVTAGATTNIGGIFISPTIDIDKSQVKKGDTISIFGHSAPKSSVIIMVDSPVKLLLETTSDATGAYLYNLDSSSLEIGSHRAKAKAVILEEISDFSAPVSFDIGSQTVLKKKESACGPIGDLNCDGRVNLGDFSIMNYWYQRPFTTAGTRADVNHDGKVNLTDFSILAFHWTG